MRKIRWRCRVRHASWSVVVFSAAPAAWAQAEATPPSEVQVIGTRAPAALGSVVSDVVVIDRDRIRASSADSIEDLLRREGGMQASRNGGPGQTAGLMIRGSSSSSTLVLIDGVRIGSATLGQTDLAAISLGQVERIEIMRGPGSSLYGADAIGGVVNIVTRRGDGAPYLRGNIAGGNHASGEGYAALSGSNAGFDYALSVSGETTNGVSAVRPGDLWGIYNPDDDGFSRYGLSLAGGYSWQQGQRIGISYSGSRLRSKFDSAEFLPPNFLPDASPDFRNRLDTQLTTLQYQGTLSTEWTNLLRASYQTDQLESGANVISTYNTTRRQFTAQTTWQASAQHQLVGAIDYLDESIYSSDYQAPSRDNTGLVLGYTGRFGAQKLQADLRWDHNSAYDNQTTGKLGWGMDIADGWSVRAVAGTAFRAPTFNDLYYPGYGVATLQAERSRSIEAGVNYKAAMTSLAATAYYNKVSDLIGYQADPNLCPPGFPFGCAGNTARALLQGITMQGLQQWGNFQFTLALDWLNAKDRDTDEQLPRRAANQQTFAVDWTEGPWQLGGTVLRVSQRPDAGVLLPAYALLNLNARWRFERFWQIEARLQNATGRDYQPARDYQDVGRQFWIGLRYDGKGL
ncbi:MAG: TonB-dependent receptor [Proteobacteria bacterium]|nr:TonB-dependent receptor [Pseudomonadota bacterium]